MQNDLGIKKEIPRRQISAQRIPSEKIIELEEPEVYEPSEFREQAIDDGKDNKYRVGSRKDEISFEASTMQTKSVDGKTKTTSGTTRQCETE